MTDEVASDKECTIPDHAAPTMQGPVAGWNAHCSEVELAMMPTPCTQWTSTWPNAVPSLPSYDISSEAIPIAFSDKGPTWPAIGLENHPSLNLESLNTLSSELELSAMPAIGYSWPLEGSGLSAISNDNWRDLCGEVEISTMQNTTVP